MVGTLTLSLEPRACGASTARSQPTEQLFRRFYSLRHFCLGNCFDAGSEAGEDLPRPTFFTNAVQDGSGKEAGKKRERGGTGSRSRSGLHQPMIERGGVEGVCCFRERALVVVPDVCNSNRDLQEIGYSALARPLKPSARAETCRSRNETRLPKNHEHRPRSFEPAKSARQTAPEQIREGLASAVSRQAQD
jgi:hypothetical protein